MDYLYLGMLSDGFFELTRLPKKVALVGAGYIAIELAGIFAALGSDVTLIIRQKEFLRSFDNVIREAVYVHRSHSSITFSKSHFSLFFFNSHSMASYIKMGIHIVSESTVVSVVNQSSATDSNKNLKLTLSTGAAQATQVLEGFEELIFAVGRSALTEPLNLGVTGAQLNPDGFISVDAFQNTAQEGLYALGDVCGVAMLTPGIFYATIPYIFSFNFLEKKSLLLLGVNWPIVYLVGKRTLNWTMRISRLLFSLILLLEVWV
jgi:glutathione reductase (NADPH)